MSIIQIISEMLFKINCIGPWDLRFYIGFLSLLPFYLVFAFIVSVSFKLLNRRRHGNY